MASARLPTVGAPRTAGTGRAGAAWPILAGGVVILSAIALSLFVGSNPLPVGASLDALTGGGGHEAQYVIWEQRLPRTVAGLAVGAALGAAGALIQAFTRNPLADPGILGVNAGAASFVAIGIVFLGITDPVGYLWLACTGALVLTLIVAAIGSRGSRSGPVTLTVTGVAVGAALSGVTTGLVLTNPDAFDRMRGWNAGSLLERGFDVVVPATPLLLVGLVIAIVVSRSLNSVALGSDVARSQGVSVRRTRIAVLAAVTLLAGSATAIAGPIVFVGLMIPHLVRWTVGADQRRIILGSMLTAPSLVLLSDVVGRIAVSPSEMPVGIVTAFVGAPVLIALVRRAKASAL